MLEFLWGDAAAEVTQSRLSGVIVIVYKKRICRQIVSMLQNILYSVRKYVYYLCHNVEEKKCSLFLFFLTAPTIAGTLRFVFLPTIQMQACCHSHIAITVENMKENMINFVL